jgi:hypothetical protein
MNIIDISKRTPTIANDHLESFGCWLFKDKNNCLFIIDFFDGEVFGEVDIGEGDTRFVCTIYYVDAECKQKYLSNNKNVSETDDITIAADCYNNDEYIRLLSCVGGNNPAFAGMLAVLKVQGYLNNSDLLNATIKEHDNFRY